MRFWCKDCRRQLRLNPWQPLLSKMKPHCLCRRVMWWKGAHLQRAVPMKEMLLRLWRLMQSLSLPRLLQSPYLTYPH
ncbi:hypothetical protein D3C71_2084060 [compost metagenome]